MYISVSCYDTSSTDQKLINNIHDTNQNIFIVKIISCFLFLLFLTIMLFNYFINEDDSSTTNILFLILVMFFLLYTLFLSNIADFFHQAAINRFSQYINEYVSTTKEISDFINSPMVLLNTIFDNINKPIYDLPKNTQILNSINKIHVDTNNFIQECNNSLNNNPNLLSKFIQYNNFYLSFVLNTFNQFQESISSNLNNYNYILQNINKSTNYISNINNIVITYDMNLNNNVEDYFNSFIIRIYNYFNKLCLINNGFNYVNLILNYNKALIYNQSREVWQLTDTLSIISKKDQLYYVYVGYDICFNIDLLNFQKIPLKSLQNDYDNNKAKVLLDKKLATDNIDLFCCYNNNSVFISYNQTFLLIYTSNLGTYTIKGSLGNNGKLYILDSIITPEGTIFKFTNNATNNIFSTVEMMNPLVNKDKIIQYKYNPSSKLVNYNSNIQLSAVIQKSNFDLPFINNLLNVNYYGLNDCYTDNVLLTSFKYSINHFAYPNISLAKVIFPNYSQQIIITNKNGINEVKCV